MGCTIRESKINRFVVDKMIYLPARYLPSSSLEKECESDCTSSFGILNAKMEEKLKNKTQNELSLD